ncbi:MAG: hypothetical protein NT076_00535, partial [Candidatus Pacearchaeota archaeon]|nr:hypothetical protein [Candidatus Pacearchaeota archaeon]
MANKIIAYHGSNRDLTKILGDGALFPFGEKVDERSYNAQALDKLIAQMAELGKKHLPECKDMSDWDAAYKFHMDGPRVIPMEDFNPLDYEYRESLRKSCIYLGDYEVAERHALGRDGHVLEFSSADGTLLPWGNFF